jgi:hypothetical protein
LDMGDPWELVKPVREALAPSAMVAGICPTMNQAERLVQTLLDEGFVATETLELIARNIEARPGMTRPRCSWSRTRPTLSSEGSSDRTRRGVCLPGQAKSFNPVLGARGDILEQADGREVWGRRATPLRGTLHSQLRVRPLSLARGGLLGDPAAARVSRGVAEPLGLPVGASRRCLWPR